MNTDYDINTNECMNTAEQIFHYCGVDSSGSLPVDTLMDKVTAFMKNDKSEYIYLRSLIDPDQVNPEVTVSMLAGSLSQYTINSKNKFDLDESFNLKGGHGLQDSDSGISSDGLQILDDLQSELREKTHRIQQLQTQLELTAGHHEETLATLTSERDTLREQLNIMREENMSMSRTQQDYEEAADRLTDSERALSEARSDLTISRHRAARLADQLAQLETEKLTLQELLTKSKDECHRINEMYATRQSLLLEENETLKTENADQSARLQDQEEFMQQIIKEKVLLEMELKDVLNKSNHIQSCMDQSVDVSYTEDQMLTALDSLNVDSKFIPENHILDEDSFLTQLKEEQGRPTNVSLFDEIRLSFCNQLSRSELNCTEFFERRCEELDSTFGTLATQTEDILCMKCSTNERDDVNFANTSTQTDVEMYYDNRKTCFTDTIVDLDNTRNLESNSVATNAQLQIYEVLKNIDVTNVGIQTAKAEPSSSSCGCQTSVSCIECEALKSVTTKLENDLNKSHLLIVDLKKQLFRLERNFNVYRLCIEQDRNTVIDNLQTKLDILETGRSDQSQDKNSGKTASLVTRSDHSSISTQTQMACVECVKRAKPCRSISRYVWEPLKCLFQLFAVVCFICAVSLLYGIRRWPSACRELPWRWLRVHELMDLLLRVEYVAEVPM